MTRTKLANQVHKVLKDIDPSAIREVLRVVVDIVALEQIESDEADPARTESAWALLGEAQRKAGMLKHKAGRSH